MKDKCRSCWNEIEHKVNVLYCEKCRERIDREIAEIFPYKPNITEIQKSYYKSLVKKDSKMS